MFTDDTIVYHKITTMNFFASRESHLRPRKYTFKDWNRETKKFTLTHIFKALEFGRKYRLLSAIYLTLGLLGPSDKGFLSTYYHITSIFLALGIYLHKVMCALVTLLFLRQINNLYKMRQNVVTDMPSTSIGSY